MMNNSRYLRLFLSLFLTFVLLTSLGVSVKPVAAATITVINTENSGPGSLREALLNASPGDTIKFSEALQGQTIVVSGDPLFIQKNVTIDGSSLWLRITISGDDQMRVFDVFENVEVKMIGLNIAHGYKGGLSIKDGGGIYLSKNAKVTLKNCNLFKNRAKGNGGAIAVGEQAILEAYNCIFSDNTALEENTSSGGAIYNLGSVYTYRSTFNDNFANWGGGIENSGSLTVSESQFLDNSGGNQGGAIRNIGLVEISDSIFSENTAQMGGAILNWTDLEVINSEIIDNFAPSGGGVFNFGIFRLENSTFNGNQAVEGGGVYNSDDAELNSSNNYFFKNTAEESGGGIYNSAVLHMTGDTFEENSAETGGGGGIENQGILTVEASLILGNSGGIQGGAIRNVEQVDVFDSTFNENKAFFGGAILNWEVLDVTGSTFFGNTATYGGAVRNWGGDMVIKNSTVSGNQAMEDGGGIQNVDGGKLASYYNTIAFNKATGEGGGVKNGTGCTMVCFSTLIAGSTGGDCVNLGDIYSSSNNFVGDGGCNATFSGDPKIGPLANNSGPTQTHALLPGSRAIDAAHADSCPPTDQRGVTRPYGPGCDIGAFEFNPDYPYIGVAKIFIPCFLR